MALIKCKNCGKDISDKASTCIHCGNPISIDKKSKSISVWLKKHMFISILLIMLLVIVSIFVISKIIYYKDSGLIVVNGDSMFPTLENGEKKFYNKTDEIERFDIIVYVENGNTLVKRVYGLPGETISMSDGKIYINDKKILEDKYAYGDTNNIESVTLMEDEYYVLGDNREISRDSRHSGPVRIGNIKGKLYDGNNQEVELIEEKAKVLKLNYEVLNQNVVDVDYNFDIYKQYTEVTVRTRKEYIDEIETIKVMIDFKDIEKLYSGEHVLYDLPIVAYDKNNQKLNDVVIVPSKVSVAITLTEKDNQ